MERIFPLESKFILYFFITFFKWEWKESDLLADVNSLRISALTHAAKIAPLVTHCTLGKKSTLTEKKTDDSVSKCDLKISIENELCRKENKIPTRTRSSSSSSLSNSSSLSLSEVKSKISKDKSCNLKVSIENDSLKNRSKSLLQTPPKPVRKVEVSKFLASSMTRY